MCYASVDIHLLMVSALSLIVLCDGSAIVSILLVD